MNYGITNPALIVSGSNIEEWKIVIKELINAIGMNSRGGNSIEDVQKERER